MTGDLILSNPNPLKSFKLWHLIAWLLGVVVVVLAVVFLFSGDELTEAEKQAIAQMNEQLHRAYDGDILESRDGRLFMVRDKNDHGLTIRGAIGPSALESYETLAEKVVAIYTKDSPDRCLVLEKFIASL